MPSTTFGVEVDIRSRSRVKGFDNHEKEVLFEKPTSANTKEKKAGFVATTSFKEQIENIFEPLELGEIAEGYGEVIDAARKHLDTIKGRSKNLILVYDPNVERELAEATNRVFQGANTQITYDMYLKALELDKDVSIELAESASGIV